MIVSATLEDRTQASCPEPGSIRIDLLFSCVTAGSVTPVPRTTVQPLLEFSKDPWNSDVAANRGATMASETKSGRITLLCRRQLETRNYEQLETGILDLSS